MISIYTHHVHTPACSGITDREVADALMQVDYKEFSV